MKGNINPLFVRTRLFVALSSVGLTSLLCPSVLAQTEIVPPLHRITTSSVPAWWQTQNGTNSAVEIQITNPSNSNPALEVSTPAMGGYAIYGEGDSATSTGVFGLSQATSPTNGSGVAGNCLYGSGVSGHSDYGQGVRATSATGYGLYAFCAHNYAAYFDGNVFVNGAIFYPSDARYKTNITTLPNALDIILGLRGVTFDWRQNEFPQRHFASGRQIGLIAQEVEKVLPEAVSKDKQGYRSVDYIKVVPVLVGAIQAQQQEINDLKKRINQNQSGAPSNAFLLMFGGAPLLGLVFRHRRRAN
jgi:hypothetical protein